MITVVISSAALALSPALPLLPGAAFCMGVGNGSLVLVGNVLASEASRGAGPLNLINAIFGVGAIVSPALVGLSMTAFGTGIPAIWAIPFVMGAAIGLVLVWSRLSLLAFRNRSDVSTMRRAVTGWRFWVRPFSGLRPH